jgi:hypothetical protein
MAPYAALLFHPLCHYLLTLVAFRFYDNPFGSRKEDLHLDFYQGQKFQRVDLSPNTVRLSDPTRGKTIITRCAQRAFQQIRESTRTFPQAGSLFGPFAKYR